MRKETVRQARPLFNSTLPVVHERTVVQPQSLNLSLNHPIVSPFSQPVVRLHVISHLSLREMPSMVLACENVTHPLEDIMNHPLHPCNLFPCQIIVLLSVIVAVILF